MKTAVELLVYLAAQREGVRMDYNYSSARYELRGGHHQRRVSSAKLAGMKYALYNPRLPTLRRMDRDDAMSRLPTEHSRTTTHLQQGEYFDCNMKLRKCSELTFSPQKTSRKGKAAP